MFSYRIIPIFLATAMLAQAQPVRTTLDGQTLEFDQPAVMKDGRVMVPLRGIFESLGAEVLFSNGQIKATAGDRLVELQLGSRQAKINGEPAYLDVAATSLGGRTLVPLRFVSEALGAEVRWLPAQKTVELSQAGPVPISTSAARLDSVSHSAQSPLRPGDQLVVSASGQPGGQASFDLLGLSEGVSMREVSPGRYQGELTISKQMPSREATLLVHLHQGQGQVSRESSRPVKIQTDQEAAQVGVQQVLPEAGSQVHTPRPTLHVQFERPLQPGSARLYLNGQEQPGPIQVVGSSVTYLPSLDLSPGPHQAALQVLDLNGRWLSHHWTFTYPGLSNIQLYHLSNGSQVGPQVNLEGTTMPFGQVQVIAEAQSPVIPGLVGFSNRVASASQRADANGRFSVPLDLSRVPANTPVNLQLQVNGPEGRTASTQVQVRRL